MYITKDIEDVTDQTKTYMVSFITSLWNIYWKKTNITIKHKNERIK